MNQGLDTARPRAAKARTAAASAKPTSTKRQQLLAELVEELASRSPSDIIKFMRRWPSGPLSLVHLHVLTVLQSDGPLPMRALADSLDVSQASATGIVDRMEQRGLIARNR